LDAESKIGLENPGYVDVRNIAALGPATIKPLPVDENGLVISDQLDDCDYMYVTPSHQSPTTVTMPLENRYKLLEKAIESEFVLIEDDYESEFNYQSNPLPALKSLDTNDRVIYIGSLSKTIAPGLRMGYLVGPAELISELRSLRRLMLRHPAANNQHSLALFLARGYHDSLVRNLLTTYRQRFAVMSAALDRYMPDITLTRGFGGSSFWLEGPPDLNSRDLTDRVAEAGVIIEPGDIYFQQSDPPMHFFRLGFSAIATEQIEPGIRILSDYLSQVR
jgi:GntR family transcriptional regulator/MocR family aminotransferase